jgi:hypothetical protein
MSDHHDQVMRAPRFPILGGIQADKYGRHAERDPYERRFQLFHLTTLRGALRRRTSKACHRLLGASLRFWVRFLFTLRFRLWSGGGLVSAVLFAP